MGLREREGEDAGKGVGGNAKETRERERRGIVFRALEETLLRNKNTKREPLDIALSSLKDIIFALCASTIALAPLTGLDSFDWWNTLVTGVFVHSARLRKNSNDHLFQRLQNKVENSVQIRLYIR